MNDEKPTLEVSKIIESFEKLFYELSILIIFIPKTILKVLFQPNWSYNYINEQFKLKPEKRFLDYVSPVILFSWIYVIPFYFLLVELGSDADAPGIPDGLMELNIDSFGKLLLIAVFINLQPLVFAASLMMMKKEKIDKETFKKPYYYFTYLFAVHSVLFVMSTVGFMLAIIDFWFDENTSLFLVCVFTGVLSAWTLIAETIAFSRIFKNELSISFFAALCRVVLIFFCTLLFFALIGGFMEVAFGIEE